MVTDSDGRAVPLLLKVALKATDWLTAGVELDSVRVRVVGILVTVVTLMVTTPLVEF